MQTDPCISSNAPSLGASGEPGHPCSILFSREGGRAAWGVHRPWCKDLYVGWLERPVVIACFMVRFIHRATILAAACIFVKTLHDITKMKTFSFWVGLVEVYLDLEGQHPAPVYLLFPYDGLGSRGYFGINVALVWFKLHIEYVIWDEFIVIPVWQMSRRQTEAIIGTGATTSVLPGLTCIVRINMPIA